VRELIGVRRANLALGSWGAIRVLSEGSSTRPMAYVREAEGQRVLVVLNPKAKAMRLRLALQAKVLRPILDRGAKATPSGKAWELRVDGRGYGIYELE
jgi:glycosidase